MNFIHAEIGSAKDNHKSPIHNWYKFTAGFSYKFVEEIIKIEKLTSKKGAEIFDPFAGCGTTLVSAQKEGLRAVGNEAQSLMYEIIKAKINWNLDENLYRSYLEQIKRNYNNQEYSSKELYHPLLLTLYKEKNLKELYTLKLLIENILISRYRLFFRLALSQTLHKVSLHPIATPYISRNKILTNNKSAYDTFLDISQSMFNDLQTLIEKKITAKIYKHDSRKINRFIENNQCNICITSPPYLNNLDYGEVSKVHTHFYNITNNWNDITERVRKTLVTSSTTHYVENEFDLANFHLTEFALNNKNTAQELLNKYYSIEEISKNRSGRKSFHMLTLLYFHDMYLVLKEIRRVLKNNGKAYLILGDSAPYGIYINTTQILGRISKSSGFNKYRIFKIRSRGKKWKSLRFRHNIELSENVLVLE